MKSGAREKFFFPDLARGGGGGKGGREEGREFALLNVLYGPINIMFLHLFLSPIPLQGSMNPYISPPFWTFYDRTERVLWGLLFNPAGAGEQILAIVL